MARFSRSISLPSYFYLAALIIGLLAFLIALFAQHVLGMAPCAWCVFQRLILLVACFFALLAFITHQKQYNKTATTIGLLLVINTITGMVSSWHQYTVAANQFSCALTFADKAITQLGLDRAWPKVFGIYASCMDAKVNFLGLDFALWSFNLFIVLTAAGLAALWMQWRQHSR
ncbi:MAG TPA: disulfide bond formation protein B [Paenalcaligenes sp.]|nr:disulfide bond formation protein B [Paenalcaligenes sp.]